VDTSIASDRSAGFREALAGHPALRLVDGCVGNWGYQAARKEFGKVLARQPRIDGVFAQNDDMARGALDAALQVGREDEMLVIGIDGLPRAIHLVTECRQAATFLNPSPGKHAVYALLAVLEGQAWCSRARRASR
jgi:ABC-type sugar transport system substrate-binding protein